MDGATAQQDGERRDEPLISILGCGLLKCDAKNTDPNYWNPTYNAEYIRPNQSSYDKGKAQSAAGMTPQQIEERNNRAGAPVAKGGAVLLGGYVLLPAAAAIGTELIAFARNPVVYCTTNPTACVAAVDAAAGTPAGVPLTGVPVPHEVPNAGAAGKGGTNGAGGAAEDLSLLDKKAATHILDGDGRTSGGHRYGTVTPGKSEFPQSWDDQKIRNTISDIVTDPSVTWSKPDARGYTSATAKRDGVEVKVICDSKNNRIVTAYPINLPKKTKP